jgi:hypothetical protein
MARRSIIPVERIEGAILLIRDQKIILDRALAALYEVETRTLVQAVKRNAAQFPPDFMFQLSKEELEQWRSQVVMSNPAPRTICRISGDWPGSSGVGWHFPASLLRGFAGFAFSGRLSQGTSTDGKEGRTQFYRGR